MIRSVIFEPQDGMRNLVLPLKKWEFWLVLVVFPMNVVADELVELYKLV